MSLRQQWHAVYMMVAVIVFRDGACVYDDCHKATGEPAACQPMMQELIATVNFSLSVLPEDVTCGNPESHYKRLGEKNISLTCNNSTESGHIPSDMVDGDVNRTWWQSVTMAMRGSTQPLHVDVRLSFGRLYTLEGGVTLTFNSGRPEVMVIEKSVDDGVTWSPLQFYARDCRKFQNEQFSVAVTADNPTAVICDSSHVESTTHPEPGGQVIFPSLEDRLSVLFGVPNYPANRSVKEYYDKIDTAGLIEFMTFTDLRLRLLETASDGSSSFDMYYYAISDIRVRARCFCNLHGNMCSVDSSNRQVCSCQHNTAGRECEMCLPLYNDRAWQRGRYTPFDSGTANECKRCECNEHALSCVYDPEYGRGVCEACMHNTKGKNCEQCAEGYYPNASLPLNHVNRCVVCTTEICTTAPSSITESPGAFATNDTTKGVKTFLDFPLPPVENVTSAMQRLPAADRMLFAEDIIASVDSQTLSPSDFLVIASTMQPNKTVVFDKMPIYVTVGVIGFVIVVLFVLFMAVCWRRAVRRKSRGRRKAYNLSDETSTTPCSWLKKLLLCSSRNDVTLTRWAERHTSEMAGEDNYGSDFCHPVFYIDSGESTDVDTLQRGCESRDLSENSDNKRESDLVKGRLDPNSELQKKAKMPSFSALDRTRRQRLRKAEAFDLDDDNGVTNPAFDVTRANLPTVAIITPLSKTEISQDETDLSISNSLDLKHGSKQMGLHQNNKTTDLTQESFEAGSKKGPLRPSYSVPVRPKTLVIPDSFNVVHATYQPSLPLGQELSAPMKLVPRSSTSSKNTTPRPTETASGKRAPKKPRRRKPPSNVSNPYSGSDVTDVSRSSSAASLRAQDLGASDSEYSDLSLRAGVMLAYSVPPADNGFLDVPSTTLPLQELDFAGLDSFDEIRGSLV